MRIFFIFICNALEILCRTIRPIHRAETLLIGQYGNLTAASLWLDDRFELGLWKVVEPEQRYYEDYPCYF